MQIELTNVLVAAGFALASFPALAGEMPADGTKNFSTPNEAPSYFANETVPEADRVDHTTPFTAEDVAAAPEDEPAVSGGTESGRHARHASAHSSARHSLGRSRGYAPSTKPRRCMPRQPIVPQEAPAGVGTQAGAGKSSTTRHARTGAGQHASAAWPEQIEAYTQQQLVADIVGMLDALGLAKCVIIGHDWGGAVAWNAALMAPERVERVVGVNTPFLPRTPLKPTELMKAMAQNQFHYILYFQQPGVAEAELERDVRRSLRGFYQAAEDLFRSTGPERSPRSFRSCRWRHS